MGSYYDFNILKASKPTLPTYFGKKVDKPVQNESLRIQVKQKAWAVLKDYPITGSGPGTFGGVVSFKYGSALFKKYKINKWHFSYMKKFGSLDQFWPQILAELGVIGTAIFILLLAVLMIVFVRAGKMASSTAQRGLFLGSAVATVYICIYLFSCGLNMTAFLYTYSAMAGMAMGCLEPRGSKKND
jgi:O-antigen ligase